MSKEIKELIAQLEKERDDIVAFYEEVQAEIKSGELTPNLAEEILKREFKGHTYKEAIAQKNQYISEARAIIQDQRTEIVHTAAPIAVMLILAVAFAWNFGAITGLFTFDDETFYRYDVGQEYTSDSVLVLPLTTNISSLRLDGEIQGKGNARIWLHTGGARFLVASFDHREEQASPLTGFAIDTAPGQQTNNGQGPPDIPPGQADRNETENETPANETPAVEPPTGETPVEAPPAEEEPPLEETPAPETPPIEEAPPANETNETPPTPEIPIEEPPAEETPVEEPPAEETPVEETPVEEPPVDEPVVLPPTQPVEEEPQTIKIDELDNVCLETCNLIGATAPYQLQIDISGDVTVRIDTIIYGERPENITLIEIPPVNETPVNETPIELPPVNETPINITPVNETPANETPVNITPVNETNATLKTLGETCTLDTECASNVCKDNMYQGTLSTKICVADATVCVADAAYSAGTVQGDSVCTGGVWLSQSGTGRLEIETQAGTLAGIIDKYGTMAVSGPAQFGTAPLDEGWVIKDSQENPKIAVTEQGALTAAGTLVTRTTPQPTAGGDLIIRANIFAEPRAVLTETGDVLLAGDFASGVTLQ